MVNCAGTIFRANAENTSDQDWHRVMSTNVNGLFFMSRSVIKPMAENKKGVIINFGSIWGSVGSPGVVAYCASKGAVHQITRAMALDHAKEGIRINAVCPGEVNTPMLSTGRESPPTKEDLQKLADETIPVSRLAEPEEISNIVFLLAQELILLIRQTHMLKVNPNVLLVKHSKIMDIGVRFLSQLKSITGLEKDQMMKVIPGYT